MSNHNFTQEFSDCKSIIGYRDSCGVEVKNLYNSLVSIVDKMATVDADSPRKAAFATMYNKIDGTFTRQAFDALLVKIEALKTYLEDEEWIEE